MRTYCVRSLNNQVCQQTAEEWAVDEPPKGALLNISTQHSATRCLGEI